MILIIGRSGSGKDHLARELSKHGLKQVLSYTTRPPRRPDEDTHIFIKPEESCNYKDKIATTEIAGCEYFATKQQMIDNDVYIIDPHGMYELIGNCPDIAFTIVYIDADIRDRYNKALDRVSLDNEELRMKAASVFTERQGSEYKQFSDFEAVLRDKSELARFKAGHPNISDVIVSHNDYRPETAKALASRLINNCACRTA
jgi:guanylate kinase